MNLILHTQQLCKQFKTFHAVDDVNISMPAGKIYGLLGPNGAGKSTTMKMLSTLMKPSSGTAYIDGFHSIKEGHEVRKRIGFVFQEPSLDHHLTAKENMELHCLFYQIPRQERKKRIHTLLELLSLLPHQRKKVMTFSGGMKRRLEVARALLHQPKLLFLDEPTTGLDPQSRSLLWELIQYLQKEKGLSVLLTTHYLEEAEYCDHLLIMDEGTIKAEGSPQQLKSQIGDCTITIETKEKEQLIQKLQQKVASLQYSKKDNLLIFKVADAESFLSSLIETHITVQSLNVHKPTLDDVFIQLTGKGVREEHHQARDVLKQSWDIRGRMKK
ncbi:ABC transporter ATP-binding protein [Longirhabdus pacifica]|uniref:ABC transporter ATP-binding protein n=1 Tax=Longirhabdus pacifica TaxID=2305227 RepID=UPI0013E8E1A1|nr:ATP-binding cassette domain-containing protein [Longirhabdus pacifica]